MELLILAVGRLKAGPESDLCKRFVDRASKAGRVQGVQCVQVKEIAESRAQRAPDRKAQEAEILSAAAPGGFQSICLDEGGDLIDSAGLADHIRQAADHGTPGQTYMIGGPDGLDPDLIGRCDRRLSFGRLTWPHQLVRVMLAEQLYRAMTILSGHPYHRG